MPTPKVLIIGGGVIGTAIAWHLTCRKAEVTLIEAKELASGSSGACDGLIFMQSKKPGIHLELAMESMKRFKELQTVLPFPIEYTPCGGMVIIETEDEYQAMETYARDQREIGLDVKILDREHALEKEPALSGHILGAAFSPLDGQVNPMGLTIGFALGAKKQGAKIIPRTRVKNLRTKGSRVTGVDTDKGKFNADIVVNACGARAAELTAAAGIHFPITPRRGQIAVTQPVAPTLSHCLISAKYIAAKYNPDLAKTSGEGISIEQTHNGNLLLGSTREFAGFDRQNTLTGIKTILKNTAGLIPKLKTIQVLRCFAGLRPWTPDGLPLIGPVSGLQGLFMAAGHEGDGIALAPVTGDIVAKMILNLPIPHDMTPFSPDRFRTDVKKEF